MTLKPWLMAQPKTCTKCGQTWDNPADGFHRQRRESADGYHAQCKSCTIAYAKEWRKENREQHNQNCYAAIRRYRAKLKGKKD